MSPKTTNGRKRHSVLYLVEITKLPSTTLILLWVGIAVLFAICYFLLEMYVPAHAPTPLNAIGTWQRFGDSLYFSIITATSLGYGDIIPQGWSKVLVSIQSISALFIFAVLVTKLISQRQEIALQEVHKLTFEDVFHNTRGDLFVVRKDLDTIMTEALQTGNLSEESWENLTIAYQQAQSLISEIPEFYDGGNAFYTIDAKREELLLESVHRTLHRINKTINTLSSTGIDWTGHEASIHELKELIRVVDATMPIWQERSPYQKTEAFEDILILKEKSHTWVQEALQKTT
ncbi:hypothetical protein COU80_02340 [Candidatus Peregrinibacteria bacterium CG10_big_fil_rev_8_21_14_0_10_55_24]|nr:MAG: hypothetical protein COU80_02340 [Candidatus Peregrinibacteria bacterium CG10_big_fil_rev_8_21_14_0_10_55_24]